MLPIQGLRNGVGRDHSDLSLGLGVSRLGPWTQWQEPR